MPLFKLHVQVFQPERDVPLGTVFLLHGYLEHSGIYQPIIREILDQGFSVLTYDLPGHGLSDGSPASIQNFDHYQHVLLAVYQYVKHANHCQSLGSVLDKVRVVQSGCIIYSNMHRNAKILL